MLVTGYVLLQRAFRFEHVFTLNIISLIAQTFKTFAFVLILFQSHQRLPSYEEAVHRNQMPDLLQDEPSIRADLSKQRDDFADHKDSHTENVSSSQRNGSLEQEKAMKRVSRASSHGSQSSANASLERLSLRKQDYQLSDSSNHSPLSSLERSLERSEQYSRQHSHRSSSGSSHSSAHVPPVQTPVSPDTRDAVWERLYEEGEDIPRNTRQQQRVLERSVTVASSSPSNHVASELLNNGTIPNRTDCNIAELIDPTFNRKTQNNHSESSPPTTMTSVDTKPKAIPLIQPQRRRSSDKKKKDKEKECKQQ